ncbi:MAG: HDOD domain-containing protein [Myxococcales bacterium]|nr:HDOD domain-containing protein [Myxococcales bacterium]
MSQAQPAESGTAARVAAQLEQIALARIEQDRLALPALPAVATKCLELLRKNDFSSKKVTDLIETDPILAVRILRTANSAAFGARQPITNIHHAVTHLGANKLKTVMMEAAARPILESRDSRIADATRGLWEHSVAVALLSRDLAVVVGVAEPEDAYLAGLLHDVGKPVLAMLLLEAENMMASRSSKEWIDSTVWVETLQRSHRNVGVAVAKKWAVPEAAVKAIADCGDYDSGERNSVANLVRFANAVAKKMGLYVGKTDTDDTETLIMIGRSLLNIEDDQLARLATGLADRVRSR